MKRSQRAVLVSAVSLFVFAALHIHAQAADQKPSPAKDSKSTKSTQKMLRDTVVDSAGKPVAGATVEYWRYDESTFRNPQMKLSASVTTGADGKFELPLASRIDGYAVAQKPGMSLTWKNIRPFGRPNDTNMVLTQRGILAGSVRDEQGNPVSGAKVAVSIATLEPTIHWMSGKIVEDLLNATTDASGHFRIEGLPTNSSAMLVVHAAGKAQQQSGGQVAVNNLPYHTGQEDISLVVEPAGIIEGKIVLEDATQPMPIASISVSGNGPFGAPTEGVNSSADGTFRIADVPSGSLTVSARFGTNSTAAWVAAPVQVTVDSGKTSSGVQLDAVRGGIIEISTVSKADRSPVGQISVNLYKQNYGTAGMTDSNGLLRLRTLPGEFQVNAYADGWNADPTTATVETGGTNRVEIQLTPPKMLKGIIRNADGKPAPGLPVRVVGRYSMGADPVKSDADGKFELEWDTRRYGNDSTPCIFTQDVDHNLAAAESVEDDSAPVELKLAPAITIVGMAECDGKPVENTTAALIFWTGNSGMHLTDLTRKTSTPGQYEIPALPANRKYGVMVSAPGHGQQAIYDAVTPDTEAGRVELRTAELKIANLKVAGQVVDSDDKPVAGAYVNLYGDGQPNGNSRTDRQGRFAFEHVCEGTVRLSSSFNTVSGNASGSVSTEGGETNVLIKLGENRSIASSQSAKPHKLSGIINNTNGQPAAAAQVAVLPQNGSRNWTKAGPDGAFKLTWQIEPWQLQSANPTLMARDKEHNLAIAQEITEETTNVIAQLKPALSVTGMVQDADNTGLRGAQVGVWVKTGNNLETLEETTTDAQGNFQVKCLPAEGEYTFWATAKGYGRAQQRLKSETDEHAELAALVLKPANQIIAGQVLNQNDKPVSGVNIYINGDGQPSDSLTTDKDGRFRAKVCEGSIHISASSQSGFGQATATAGDTNVLITIGQSSGVEPQVPVRRSLKGSPLPDLTGFSLDAAALPNDKPILLCLFDAGQRPSRAMVRSLQEQLSTLAQQGIVLVGLQAAAITDDAFKQWKDDSHITLPVGRVPEGKTEKWISTIPALPWLILSDSQHRIIAEGFPIYELDKRVAKLAALAAEKLNGPKPSTFTQPPAPIRPATATLNGMVVPNGKTTKAWFKWGSTTNYEFSTPPQEVGNGLSVVRVSAPITGLVPGAIYHCRLTACTESGATNQGADFQFTTGMSVIAWGAPGNGCCKVPADLTNAVAIACGHGHSVALKNDGTVALWGGEGSFAEFHITNDMPANLNNVIAIAGGYAQTVALTADGKVSAWGQYLDHRPAKAPAGLSNIIAVAAGDQHAMALKADGTVVVWGNNTPYNETKMPAGLSNVVAIASGSRHCIALKADGSLVEWGEHFTVQPSEDLEGIAAISSEAFRCLAMQADGLVLDWGENGYQQLPPEGINNAVAIGAGWKHSLAVRADGTVAAWGNNEWKQLEVPPGLCSVVAVAAGDVHSIAIGKLATSPVAK